MFRSIYLFFSGLQGPPQQSYYSNDDETTLYLGTAIQHYIPTLSVRSRLQTIELHSRFLLRGLLTQTRLQISLHGLNVYFKAGHIFLDGIATIHRLQLFLPESDFLFFGARCSIMVRSGEDSNIIIVLSTIVGSAFLVALSVFLVYVNYCEDNSEKKRLEDKSN